ncbi:MAG TPA: MerR family DNA-binding transcriptional regulator [Burkholderiales bacterium]|nr:MerR family DNA-binding transcriptional regulator [Burkholderiales bacterium]
MPDPTYTITELAKEFGLTTRAIRFYEDHGLISPARAGRNRVYGNRDRVRLKLTLRGKRLGLSLLEIRELIDMYDAARDEHAQVERLQVLLRKRRGILEQQREDIEAVLGEIAALEQECDAFLQSNGLQPGKPARRSTSR